MAKSVPVVMEEPHPEVPGWLKSIPLAPEYHPTIEEFEDPISYILKIEDEASKYGICKIIPPFPIPSKETAIDNLNRSLSDQNPCSNSKSLPTFTTRVQQIGFRPRKNRPVKKPVWQSGEVYTVEQFEEKAKNFEKTQLKKLGNKGISNSPLEIENLFWKSGTEKPFKVEYGNDMPGSAFVPINAKKWRELGEGKTVGETVWNMRGFSRVNGSLLRFMKEEIPGVTSPMVYIAMLFSWFAWHVEDHDLHSLNYLHMGAPKTWYGIPREAATAFEDVIRVHSYGGEVNPLVAFATLGEKNTIMSPEVLVGAGVPCCRLVQNVGEFVITFPRAYHSGFSHGFNCGEALNFATPEWLKFAEEAAIRRASVNSPPMVSHFQLLYAFALTLRSSEPVGIGHEHRSSNVKDKNRDERDPMIKELFLNDMIRNDERFHLLLDLGFSYVFLPKDYSETYLCSNMLQFESQAKVRAKSGVSKKISDDIMVNRGANVRPFNCLSSSSRTCPSRKADSYTSTLVKDNMGTDEEGTSKGTGLLGEGLFSCVTCGVLNFTCAAIIQPKEAAIRYLTSAGSDDLFNLTSDSGLTNEGNSSSDCSETVNSSGWMETGVRNRLYEVPIQYGEYQIPIQPGDERVEAVSDNEATYGISALDLIASTYGNSWDFDDGGAFESDTEDCSPLEQRDRFPSYDPISASDMKQTWSCYNFEVEDQEDLKSSLEKDMDMLLDGPLNWNTNMSLSHYFDDNTTKKNIFCLEHAMEVEKQLRQIGGANLLLIFHPDYLEVQAEAKSLAVEMGVDYLWKGIPFKEANEEDIKIVQSALIDEESVPDGRDWTVKLGVNLYYNANLSYTPLHRKQMPCNSIIYKAFGHNSPDISPVNEVYYSKELSKKKESVVAGKWCGKVWMTNQVHPYLAQRETQEDDSSTFHARNINDGENERKPNTGHLIEELPIQKKSSFSSSENIVSGTPSKKRKRTSVKCATMTVKRPELDTPVEVEPEVETTEKVSPISSSGQCWRNLRSRVKEQKTPHLRRSSLRLVQKQNSNTNGDIDEGGPSKRLRSRKNPNPPSEVETNVTQKKGKTDSEAKYQCDIDGCSMGFSSKQELVLHKRNICPVKGCGKKLFSHKYMAQHRRVHENVRHLKCTHKGCEMTFKWAWARTEHLRVHSGAKPYACSEPGCEETFRFVSDFSRHKRKTGHSVRRKS